MRNSTIKTFLFAIPFLLLSLAACKKDVAGPKGDPGKDGGKGNLVKSERTFTVQATSWVNTTGYYSTIVYCPEISNDVISKGEVEVYMKVGTQWWNLPYLVGDIVVH